MVVFNLPYAQHLIIYFTMKLNKEFLNVLRLGCFWVEPCLLGFVPLFFSGFYVMVR